MPDEPKTGGAPQPSPAIAQPTAQIGVATQYVKDFSFENPGAPQSLLSSLGQPDIRVNVGVQATPLPTKNFEVVLSVTADAKQGDKQLFLLELSYGGVFQLSNIAEQQQQAVLLVECPPLLFPFARRVIADATRDGGFPPLLLAPIDFLALYREQQQRAQAGAAPAPVAT